MTLAAIWLTSSDRSQGFYSPRRELTKRLKKKITINHWSKYYMHINIVDVHALSIFRILYTLVTVVYKIAIYLNETNMIYWIITCLRLSNTGRCHILYDINTCMLEYRYLWIGGMIKCLTDSWLHTYHPFDKHYFSFCRTYLAGNQAVGTLAVVSCVSGKPSRIGIVWRHEVHRAQL